MEKVKKLGRAVIREEYVAITGDYIKAIILNQFVYWSERIDDFDHFIEAENQRAKESGQKEQEYTDGWIYKTAEELSSETMLGMTPASMRVHIKALIEAGFINERNNPQYKWDRTKQYRVDLVKINEALAEKGYSLQDYKTALPFLETKNGSEKNHGSNNNFDDIRTVENYGAIPETTTETTTEINITISDRDEKETKTSGEKRESDENSVDMEKPSAKFTTPTVDEVRAYCVERKNGISPEAFVDHYVSNGWKIGKAPMKDWRAAVRTWERNAIKPREPVPDDERRKRLEADASILPY